MLSTRTVLGYSTTAQQNNKISRINSILQHTYTTVEYSDYARNSMLVFLLHKIHARTTVLTRTIYPVTLFGGLLSPA